MERVTSTDGTQIAYEKTGNGPPMVIVHGAPDDHTYWEMVIPALANYYTVYAVDRRGRGQSSDATDYKIELEFDDIAAVADMIDEPVILLGHSHGGIVALEAALRTNNLRKLILYEPPIMEESEEPDEFLQNTFSEIESALDQGNNEQALLVHLETLLGMPNDEIDKLRSTPYWTVMVKAAPTLPRELQADVEYRFDASRFNGLAIPSLLLTGSESLPLFKEATEKLNGALPNSIIAKLEGQEHDAARTAPELFANEVLKFARGSD